MGIPYFTLWRSKEQLENTKGISPLNPQAIERPNHYIICQGIPRYSIIQMEFYFLFLFLVLASSQTCQRCVCPCSQTYCLSDSSNTWNSSFSYSSYGYTKLVLSLNASACSPCPYSCQTCTSQYYTSCTLCMPGFYNNNSTCNICPSHCATCTVANNLTVCLSCFTGTYLDNNGNCMNCPDGALTCTSSTITACSVGYYSVSAIVCLPCVDNCQSCSSVSCQICVAGYYLSAGSCIKCSSSCLTCTSLGCSSCPSGYYLLTRQCYACPSNCNTCSSSTPTLCTTCQSGYYNNNGLCSLVSSNISNCNVYSSSSTCSRCNDGTYLLSNKCLPCSVTCANCWGSHFGLCSSCSPNNNLFNSMCLANNYPNRISYQLYYHIPAYQGLFAGGSVTTCIEPVYSGTKITLALNNLAASSITIKYKLYIIDASSPTYTLTLNTQSPITYTSNNTLPSICSSSASEMYDIRSVSLTSILRNNTLTFASTSTIGVAEVSLLAIRCTSLCSVCTATLCSSCLLSSLYTQLDQCVYACSNSYYTYETNKTCLAMCAPGTYTVSTNLTCIDCTAPCATCNSSTSCLSCIDGYFLYNNSCKVTCPLYYYPLTGTYVCSICVGRCLACVNATFCQSCLTGFINNGRCLDNCSTIQGMYSDMATISCGTCDSSCLNCTSLPTLCTACYPSTPLLYNSTCLSSCPPGFYILSNTCYKCSYPCLNCTGSPTNCTACLNSYAENGNCVSNCSLGKYPDLSTLSCESCHVGCSGCVLNSTYCLQCNSGYYLYNYRCLIQCPSRMFGQSKLCKSCILPCLTCSNQTFCLSCSSNFLNATTGTCVNQADCSPSFYADITTLTCLTCSSPCSTCVVKPSLCTSCQPPLYLLNYSCVATCTTYLFPDTSTNQCSPCISPCLTCTNSTYCKSCISGYIYYSSLGSCLSYCPSGQYIDSQICYPCKPNCLSCTNSTNCQKCAATYYLFAASNTCVSNCSSANISFYGDSINAICSICIAPCSTCNNIVDCTSCITGLLYENRCVSACPFGYFSESNNTCSKCAGSCSSCSGTSTNCTSCSNLYLYQSDCLSNCPGSFFPNLISFSCEPCPAKCSTCVNSTYCTSCLIGFLDSSNNCINSCPIGYFMSAGFTCQPCDPECQSCSGSATNCLSCNPGFYLSALSVTSSVCVTVCSPTQYLLNRVCYNCSTPCLSCSSASNCLTCIPGTLFYSTSSSCLSSCPLGTYNSSSICESCTSPCNTCSNSSYCLTCTNSSLYVSQGSCVEECPAQFFGEESTMICVSCTGLCQTCNSSLYCLSCKSGYLIEGFCYDTCPLGTYSVTNSSCARCQLPCLTCWQSSTNCLKCIDGLLLYNNTCSSQCPNNTYLQTSVCVNCPFPCVTCSSSVVCSSCLGGYLLYLNTTCIEGPSCPNGLYNMNGLACVMEKDCPSNYYLDTSIFTCSSECELGRYTFLENRTCLGRCPDGYYASFKLVCQGFQGLTQPLLGSKMITYIKSSELFVELVFNQSVSWDYAITNTTYILAQALISKRLLLTSNNISYSLTSSPNILQLYKGNQNISLRLPAYYLKSSSTNLPLQTPTATGIAHFFTIYTQEQKYTSQMFFQISQSLGWIILIISVGFLAINRLSDIYILWDFPQLFYFLIYLDIQYPPNFNEFIRGLRNLSLYFFPNLFKMPDIRQVSPPPYYSQSYDVNFLRSSGHILIVFIIYLLAYLILKISYFVIQKSETLSQYQNFKKLVYKGLLRYRWHYTNDFFFVTILNIIIFSVSQTFDLQEYYLRIGSFVLILVCVLVYIAFPIFVGTKLYRHLSNIKKGKLIQNLKCFYRGIEKTNSFGISLILLRYLRKILYGICIPLLSSYPLFVLPILTVCSFLFALFIWSARPFKKRISNIINIITEVTAVVILMLISIMQFESGSFSIQTKWVIGWICSILITVMIFAQLFYIFCKTMFYLQPEREEQRPNTVANLNGKRSSIRTKSYLRQKAEEFFNKMYPNLKFDLGLDSSDDEYEYSQGDSQNSQNNEFMRQAMNMGGESEESEGDMFYHYDAASHPSHGTRRLSIPKYMIKCVNEIERRRSSKKLSFKNLS